MRVLVLAACIALASAPAWAQSSFENPSPIDYTKPFFNDRTGTLIRGVGEESALSVETTNREDLLNRGRIIAPSFGAVVPIPLYARPSLSELVEGVGKEAALSVETAPRERQLPASSGELVECAGEGRGCLAPQTTSREDLLNRGTPSAAEFVRSLSELGNAAAPTCIRYYRARWIEEGRPDLAVRLRQLSMGGRCVTVDFSEHTTP